MKNKINISAIVPAYNVEKYIEKTLRSIMEQTLKEIEIIVINDGSKDSTLSIIKKLMLEDNRIVLIDKKNGGVSQARNVGIKKARGEYLSFIDGDDWIEKDFFEESYKYGIENNLDMIACDMSLDYFRRKKNKIHPDFGTNKIISGKEYLDFYYDNDVIRGVANKIIKKEIFIKNNLFFLENVPSGEDMNLTIKLGYVISRIGKINKAYYHYIQYSQSVTKQKTSNKIYPFLKSFDDIREFIKKIDINLLKQDEDKIYKYEVNSVQNFVVKDSDWKNQEYIKAVEIFLELVKNKKIDEAIENFKFGYKVLWKICKKYPSIFTVKILHYMFRWIEALKEKIYVRFYL